MVAERTAAALQSRGLHNVQVHVDADQQLMLTGYVTDAEEEQLVLGVARAQPGVGRVRSRMVNRTQATIHGIQQGAFASSRR
jgi:hypothetical protein